MTDLDDALNKLGKGFRRLKGIGDVEGDAGGVEGRYVRLGCKGNNIDGKNHYTEVEVFGRPIE